MSNDELELVDWLTRNRRLSADVPFGIGDDMACVLVPAGRALITSDMLLDGVHFDAAVHSNSQIGRKAVACSLSDCAAMAVRPVAVFVSIALSNTQSPADARQLLDAISAEAATFGATLAGGDTNRWSHPLAIDVTVMACPYEGIEPIRRSGAAVGDVLYVTGPLGGSRRGHHLSFTPRVREAHNLASVLGPRLHAMIDISDGLSLDLWRLCSASGVGAALDQAALEPLISEDARLMSTAGGVPALNHLLSDGEDYELLLAVDAGVDVTGLGVHRVGWVTERGLSMQTTDGTLEELQPRGWVH